MKWTIGSTRVAQNADGRLEAFGRGTDDAIYHRWQTAPNSTSWNAEGWLPLSGAGFFDPLVAQNADGRLEVFAVGPGSALFHRWQTAPNALQAAWNAGGMLPLGGATRGGYAVSRNANGRLEVFVRGTDDAIYHRWQTAPNSTSWNAEGWSSLGGGFRSRPAVFLNAERLEVFGVGTDNAIYHRWQTAPNSTSWNAEGWRSVGGGFTDYPVVFPNADGRLEVFGRGTDGQLYHRWQQSPGGNRDWVDRWYGLGGQFDANPVVFRNEDGRLEAFGHGTDHFLYHTWQTGPNVGHEGWNGGWTRTNIPSQRILELAAPVVFQNLDGRLEVFHVRWPDQALHHQSQNAPNSGAWSGGASLGGGFDAFGF